VEKWKVEKEVKSAKYGWDCPKLTGKTRGTLVARPQSVPPWNLAERTRLFALDVLAFCRRLPNSSEARDAGRQLLRAANSTRSNYRSARRARSRAEFRSKLQVAFEEADESVDWLEYLRDGRILHDEALIQEARELASILAASVRSARRAPQA